MARFTSNQWAVINQMEDNKVIHTSDNTQSLFADMGLRSGSGKLSLKQGVYKLYHKWGADFKIVSVKDNKVYVFDRTEDIGKGQSDYRVLEYFAFDYPQILNAFRDGSTPPPTPKHTTPTPKATPKAESKQTKTAEQLMAEAMQLLAQGTKGSVDAESVVKIVHDELAKIDRPKVVQIEVKLPNGSKTSVKGQHKEFDKLLRLMGAKKSVMLVGDAGSGKTYGSKVAAQTLGLDFRIFSFTNETSLGRTMGFMNAMGEYVPTAVREMYENGGVLILDEFDAANPNVAMALNNLLDGDEYVFADKVVKRHEEFRYVACTNTYANGANKKYNARNKMDDSTMDRFSAVIDWGYDEVMERRLFGDTEATRVVQQIRSNANKMGLNGLITPRRTRDVNEMVSIGFSIKEAVKMSILAKHKRDVQKGLTEGVSL